MESRWVSSLFLCHNLDDIKVKVVFYLEEQTLILYGWPVEDAISLCHSMRRTGELPAFMQREHEKYVERINERNKARMDG